MCDGARIFDLAVDRDGGSDLTSQFKEIESIWTEHNIYKIVSYWINIELRQRFAIDGIHTHHNHTHMKQISISIIAIAHIQMLKPNKMIDLFSSFTQCNIDNINSSSSKTTAAYEHHIITFYFQMCMWNKNEIDIINNNKDEKKSERTAWN